MQNEIREWHLNNNQETCCHCCFGDPVGGRYVVFMSCGGKGNSYSVISFLLLGLFEVMGVVKQYLEWS